MQLSKIDSSKFWYILSSAIITMSSMVLLALTFAPTASAADPCSGRGFLGLPTWYRGLTDSTCNIRSPSRDDEGVGNFVWRIVLNVIEALMMVVGYASVVMIIVGGFFYMTAAGQADKIKSAKNTILNAVIGLVIALASVAIVNVVARII